MAAAGLRALQRGIGRSAALRPSIERWRRPRALLAEGGKLVGRARAAIDVSDGLAGDAAHLGRASRVRVVFDAERLEAALAPDFLRAAAALNEDPLSLALQGGEDYVLLAAGPAASRPRGTRSVGFLERGTGVVLMRGKQRHALNGSFEHFAAGASRARRR